MEPSDISNAYRNKATLALYYGMSGLVLFAAGVYLMREQWASALTTLLIFGLMFVPSIIKERYRIYLPFAVHFGIVLLIFLTLFLGEIGRFYDRIPLWDKFLHFQSGFILGSSGYVLVYLLNEHKKIRLGLSPGFVSLFAVTFSLALGAVWEMFEFAGDSYFSQHIANYSLWQASNADTMWDLIADGAGALILSIIGYFWMYRHKRLPFTPWMIKMRDKLKHK